MKRIAKYTIILAAIWSAACLRTDEPTPQFTGNELVVCAELVTSSDWVTTRSDDSTIYGTASESTDGAYLIFASKQPWTGNANTIPVDTATTRGTPIGSAANIANMRVKVFNTGASSWSTSATLTRAIDATNDNGGFTTSPSYNWPTNPTAKTSLFAYSPIPTGVNGITDVAPNKLNYTVPTDVTKQPDLCVATPNINVINNDGAQQAQNFALKHQLTAVGFAMLGWNLKITQITVSGIACIGTLTMNPSGAPSWTTSGTSSRNVGVTGNSFLHNYNSSYANITTSDGYLMMIPQTLSDAAYMTIFYTSTTTGTTGSITANLKPLGLTWNAGDKITYNIRLKTAPAVTNNELIIENNKAGYTTSQPLSFITDNKDNLTFTWNASWLKIYRGSPKTGDVNGGNFTGWATGIGGAASNIYFFSTEDNNSTIAYREATVTVSGTRSGTRTFTVKQQCILPTLSISPNTGGSNLPWSSPKRKVTITSNTSWKLSSATNCKATPSSGTGNQTVEIFTYINYGVRRNVSCTFTTDNPSNNVSASWTGTQVDNPFKLDPSKPTANIGVYSGTYSIRLHVGVNWRITSQKNCTVTPSSGSGNSFSSQTLTLTYDTYNGTVDREVSFEISADGRTPITWKDIQEAPYMYVDCGIPNGALFNIEGRYQGKQYYDYRIVTNTKWTATVQDNIGLNWGVVGPPVSGFGPFSSQVAGNTWLLEGRSAQIQVTGYRPNGTVVGTDYRGWRQFR